MKSSILKYNVFNWISFHKWSFGTIQIIFLEKFFTDSLQVPAILCKIQQNATNTFLFGGSWPYHVDSMCICLYLCIGVKLFHISCIFFANTNFIFPRIFTVFLFSFCYSIFVGTRKTSVSIWRVLLSSVGS